MNKILLLDAHTVQSISVARALKDSRCFVTGFISEKMSYGYVSRYIDNKIICPKKYDECFESFLKEYLINNKCDIIIPLYDDSAEWLSRNKNEIEGRFSVKCAIPQYDVFVKAFDKGNLMNLCREYNLPHPRTMLISEDNLNEAIDYVGFPSLIKPNISSGARGIVMVNNETELREKLVDIEKNFGVCSLQEFINHTGVYYNVMIFRDRNGVCSESVILKIMRYFPLKGGTSCYCEIVENENLTKICEKTLEVLDWKGFADFDIMESVNGDYKIIEINTRVPASVHGAYISGVNYPEMIIRDAEGVDVTCRKEVGNVMRFAGLDVMWFVFSPERFSFRPSWFKFFGRNVFYQDGSWRDPLPMIAGVLSGVVKYMNPEFRKSKLKK